MTLSYQCVVQNFLGVRNALKVGETIIVNAPSSSSFNGVAVLEIVRLTEEYCKVREVL
jgi:hypothetical protein